MGAGAELDFRSPPGELPDASVSNAELATMAAATVKGRAVGAGTGAPTDLTAAQVNTIVGSADLTVSNALLMGTSQVTNPGSFPWDVTLQTNATRLFLTLAGAGDITSMTASTAGRIVFFQSVFANIKRIVHQSGGSGSTKFTCPNDTDYFLGPRENVMFLCDGSNGWLVYPMGGGSRPGQLAPLLASLAVPFNLYVSCPSGGAAGTADDVTVPVQTFAYRILDATLRVSTAVGGSTAALRTASGGGGSVVLPDPAAATQTFSTATTGPHDDVAVATATVAASGTLFLRRSDRSVVGELILTCIRT